MQNIPVEWEGLRTQLEKCEYTPPFELPRIRKYIIPDPGKVFVGRDFMAQEMRLLAHFAGGALLESVQKEPFRDVHQIAAEIAGISRRVAKTLGFAVLYGAGVGRIAESLYIPVEEASRIKAKYLAALPEIKRFSKEIMDIGKAGGIVRTLGGRGYKTDPAVKIINGRVVTYEYKLVNYCIQGSASDHTKTAMVSFADMDVGDLMLSVHDQLVAQVPIANEEACMAKLKDAMDSAFADKLRCKIPSDGASGYDFASI